MKLKSVLLSTLIFLTGCARFFITDPSADGQVSPQPGVEWMPPEGYVRLCLPIDPIDDDVEVKGTLSLGDMLDIALRNNPLTQIAWSQARVAAFNLGASKSLYYPVVTVDESYEWVDTNFIPKALIPASTTTAGTTTSTGIAGSGSTFGPNSFQELQSDLLITYLLLDFGGRSATVEAARQGLYTADWAYNLSIQTVLLNVLTAYYNYLDNWANVKATELSLRDSIENLDATLAMFNAGLVTKVDVLLARSNLVNTEFTLENYRGMVRIALSGLATALGLPANTQLSIDEVPEIPKQDVAGDLEHLMEIAKTHRPDLAQYQAEYLQAKANLIVAESEAAPTINGSVELLRGDYFKSSLLRSHVYTSMISVNIPIFQGFFYEYNIREAKANIDVTYANWKEQELTVLNNVAASYYAFKTAVEELKFSEEYVLYAQEAYDATFFGYKAGTNTFLDLLSAQTTLANARSQLINTRVLWAQSLSTLAYNMGILNTRTEKAGLDSLFKNIKNNVNKSAGGNAQATTDNPY